MLALIGGSGFIGSEIVKTLLERGSQIKNISKEKNVAGVQNINIDIKKPIDQKVFSDVETIVHLAAVIREVGDQTFKNVNIQGTKNVCEAAKQAGVKNLIYFSNIGAQNNPQFPFLYSKWQGEEIVKQSGLAYSILRPSIVFGLHDEFINKLAKVIKLSPIIPVFGDGKTRFTPIHVSDIAQIVLAVICENDFGGKTYEIGGPEILTYDELVKTIGDKLGIKRIVIHIPLTIARPLIAIQEFILPNPQITHEQLKMIALDNVPKENAAKTVFKAKLKELSNNINYVNDPN